MSSNLRSRNILTTSKLCDFITSLNKITKIWRKSESSRKQLRIKITPDLHLTYSKKRGKPGVGIENDKHILFLNIFDKTCKHILILYLFKIVLYSTITFNMKLLS